MSTWLRRLFHGALRLNVALTRSRWGRPIEGHLTTPLFVALTRSLRGAPVDTVEGAAAMGREWVRLQGHRPTAVMTSVDADSQTAYGRITIHCPLRGTGDVEACHRLMAYDRRLMAASGARFVVLASQAEPGRTSCRVALRPAHLPHADLVPAHRAVRTLRRT